MRNFLLCIKYQNLFVPGSIQLFRSFWSYLLSQVLISNRPDKHFIGCFLRWDAMVSVASHGMHRHHTFQSICVLYHGVYWSCLDSSVTSITLGKTITQNGNVKCFNSWNRRDFSITEMHWLQGHDLDGNIMMTRHWDIWLLYCWNSKQNKFHQLIRDTDRYKYKWAEVNV